jgi:hypothetical protein
MSPDDECSSPSPTALLIEGVVGCFLQTQWRPSENEPSFFNSLLGRCRPAINFCDHRGRRRIGIHERSEPHWVKAIAEINNAMADPARESTARKALYAALVIAKRAL